MDSKIMSVRAKPLSLKDYLLDDMSSCSSNGFRSFPRRRCCTSTTVRHLLVIELKNQQHQRYSYFKKSQPDLQKIPVRSALSAFQYVISSLKSLPFTTGRLSEAEKPKKSILVRSISRKIIKIKTATFWRRNPKENRIARLKSFDVMFEDDPVSDVATPAVPEPCSSEFTEGVPVVENDVVEVDKRASNGETMDDAWGGGSTIINTDGSGITITSSKEKLWSNKEKEQSSPVSVLDCPFDDEDDEVSSCFQHGVAHVEGTKNKLMKKIQLFESLPELEPLNLTERLALQQDSDNESPERPQQRPYESNEIEQKEDEENDIKALKLLGDFKHSHPSYSPKVNVENLVLDFFRERMTNERGKRGESSCDEELLEEVEVWIDGQNPHQPFLGWEVKANRQSYINDMERDGTWKTLDQENTEVALELETEILRALLNEMCETKVTF